MLILLSLFACGPELALVEGVAYSSYEDDAPPLAKATVRLVDADGGGVVSETTTDAKGRFELEAELGTHVYAEVAGQGLRTSRFPGVIDRETVLVEDRSVFGFAEEEAAELEALFAACPSAGGPGLAVGQVRAYGIATVVEGQNPIIQNAQVIVRTANGTEWSACYFDEEGEVHDPSALVTGATGWFVVPGLPAGEHELEVTYQFVEGAVESYLYPMSIAKQGTVSPWFPAWVGLP